MSKADKIFDELGYKRYDYLEHIDYYNEQDEKIISFRNNKTVVAFNVYDGFEEITIEELQAINEKVKELGWLNE